jgi:glycosyltransferase involved in cell wall biosynthesis
MVERPAQRLRRRVILHLAWSGRIGGIERLVEGVVSYAGGREGFVHRACLLDGRGSIGKRLVEEGLAVRLGLRRGYDLRGLWRLARLLRQLRPRVIHFHTHAVASYLVVLAAWPRAVRVYTEHSPRSLRRDPKFRLLYFLLRRSDAAFVASSAGMAAAIARRGVERERIIVIPNGVPIPGRGAKTAERNPPTVGVVARLEHQKRIDLFLDVLAELRHRGVASAGLVVGDGSLRLELMRRADALGLRRSLEFAGEQEHTVPWLDRLDVFLMTSEFEPFGIAALEAMARGVPVVAMPCAGGLVDIVGRGGLVLRDRDVQTAADGVEHVLASAEERERLRNRGAVVAEEHSFERVVEQLDELYCTLNRAG